MSHSRPSSAAGTVVVLVAVAGAAVVVWLLVKAARLGWALLGQKKARPTIQRGDAL